MNLTRVACTLIAVWSLFPTTGAAQNLEAMPETETLMSSILVPKAGTECIGGISYDDGSFEDGYGFSSSTSAGTYAMRFQLPGGTNRIDAVCICWKSVSGSSHDHGLRIWAADGPGGAPGTLLSTLPATSVSGISLSGKFTRYEVPGGITVPTNVVYVAPTWSPLFFPGRYLCADENGPGGQPAYAGTSIVDLKPSLQIGTPTSFPNYKALGIRLEAVATSACIPTPTSMCLSSGRFRVQANFRTNQGQSGSAQVVKLTEDTGYLWFFAASNVEVVVKVLNGCGVNSRYWVFAGGLTDVEVSLTVTDTQTGVSKVFSNLLGTKFAPVQDTSAFATCP